MSEKNYPGALGAMEVYAEGLGRAARVLCDDADALVAELAARKRCGTVYGIEAARLVAASQSVREEVERVYLAMSETLPEKYGVELTRMSREWWLG